MLCLGAGKHVLCEKPFALNSAQIKKMVALAKCNGLFLMEAMWMRFIPLIVELQRRIKAGEIGQVQMIQADFGFRAPLDPQSRLFNPALAGGALLDLGIYPLAFSALLLGNPEEICSLAHVGTTGVDEQSAYVLKHKGGELSVLASALRTQTSMSAWVYGTHGRIRKAVLASKRNGSVSQRGGAGKHPYALCRQRLPIRGSRSSRLFALWQN